MTQDTANAKATPDFDAIARQHANQLRELYIHAGVYGFAAIFFLAINLITNASSLWFFWPLLPWGVALAIHAFVVLGPSDAWADRKARQWQQQFEARTKPGRPETSSEPEVLPSATVNDGISRVAALRLAALHIRKATVRQQVFDLCASADRVLAVLADGMRDPQLAGDFVQRYLGPTETIVNQYVLLASRGISSAVPALAKVEMHDLPLLQDKLDELYDRLHRGDVINLQVASEMLELELAGNAASLGPSRLRQSAG